VKFHRDDTEQLLADLPPQLGLNDQIYDLLKSAILQHTMPSGCKLDVNQLAQRWRVSRTPVNDAIQRLMVEGLVSIVPRKGTFVASVEVKDLLELMDTRLMFELRAAELTVAHLSAERLSEMKNILLEMDELLKETDVDYVRYSALDLDFHFLPISWVNNSRMQKMYQAQNFQWYMTRLRKSSIGQAEHWQIYQGYESGSLKAATEALTNHIERGKASILGATRQRNSEL